MSGHDKWYVLEDIDTLDSPALVIFPDRVKANIQEAIRMVGDVSRLRPHVKTNKSADAIRLMLEAGITKFKCATIAEAELLGICGAPDVLLAYQPVGPKLLRFIKVIKKYPATSYSCLCDNLKAGREQSIAFFQAGLSVPVYLDLNVGMDRTGIIPGAEAIDVYTFLTGAPGIVVGGLHAYDGHLRDPINIRTEKCNNGFKLVEELKAKLESNEMEVPVIVAGGSPTFPIHAARKDCECSPGTFIYWDKGYLDVCPEQQFLPAVVLVSRIISCPSPTIVCTDLGHKSVAAENEISRRVFFLNADDLTPVRQSEEHLVAETIRGHSFTPGDILYGLPFHVCPTIALYERAYIAENGRITGEWENKARDRTITI